MLAHVNMLISSGTIGQGEHTQLATMSLAFFKRGWSNVLLTNDTHKTLESILNVARTLSENNRGMCDDEQTFLNSITIVNGLSGMETTVPEAREAVRNAKKNNIPLPKTVCDECSKEENGEYLSKLSGSDTPLRHDTETQRSIKYAIITAQKKFNPAHIKLQSGSIAEQTDFFVPAIEAMEEIKQNQGSDSPVITALFRDVAAASPALMRAAEPLLDRYIEVCDVIGFRGDGTVKHLDIKHSKETESDEHYRETLALQEKFDKNTVNHGYDAIKSAYQDMPFADRPIVIAFGGAMQRESYVHLKSIKEVFEHVCAGRDTPVTRALSEEFKRHHKIVFFPSNIDSSSEYPEAKKDNKGNVTGPHGVKANFEKAVNAGNNKDTINVTCLMNGAAYIDAIAVSLYGVVTGGWNSVGEMLTKGCKPVVMTRGGEGLEIHEHRVRAEHLAEKGLCEHVRPNSGEEGPVDLAHAMQRAYESAQAGSIDPKDNIRFGGGDHAANMAIEYFNRKHLAKSAIHTFVNADS